MVAALGLTATTAAADSPGYWQLGFQDTATSTAQVRAAALAVGVELPAA